MITLVGSESFILVKKGIKIQFTQEEDVANIFLVVESVFFLEGLT